MASGGPPGCPVMTFETFYREIVPQERIVYTSTMSSGAEVITISLTTVEFKPADDGTKLVLTEQGAFLDGREGPGARTAPPTSSRPWPRARKRWLTSRRRSRPRPPIW